MDPQLRIQELEIENRRLRAAVLNQCADNMCWLEDPEVGKALPATEFIESCARYHAQLVNGVGTVTARTMTIAQLEAALLKSEDECQQYHKYLDAVARVLHPSKDPEDRFTYLPDQLAGMVDQLCAKLAQAKEHKVIVSLFLSDMYAIMVDPLADGEMKISDTCAALKAEALKQREQSYQLPKWYQLVRMAVFDPRYLAVNDQFTDQDSVRLIDAILALKGGQ
jgi:hypothetical protein